MALAWRLRFAEMYIVDARRSPSLREASLVTVTPFGLLFLPVVIAVLLFYSRWLLPLLVVASVLHAPAVAVIERPSAPIGITPWVATSAAVFVHLLGLIYRARNVNLGDTQTARWLFAGWSAFCGYAVLSAFTLPFLFEGTLTYNQAVVQSIAIGTQPLTWRPVNLLHAINVCIIWMLLFYILQLPNRIAMTNALLRPFVVALALSVASSLFQRVLTESGMAAPEAVRQSLNPSYAHTIGYVFYREIARVGWPFAEPSYAGVWFAAAFAGGMGIYLFGKRVFTGLTLAAASAVGLLNSLSGGGIFASVLATIAQYGAACVVLFRSRRDRLQYAARIFAFPLVAAALIGVAYISLKDVTLDANRWGTKPALEAATDFMLKRLNDHNREGNTRSESNRVALRVVEETYGIGVGLGSNRASSFALNLASTVGIVPTLLFFGLFAVQACIAIKRRCDETIFIACGSLGVMIGVVGAIPDLAWPGLWGWILALYALAIQRPSEVVPVTDSYATRQT